MGDQNQWAIPHWTLFSNPSKNMAMLMAVQLAAGAALKIQATDQLLAYPMETLPKSLPTDMALPHLLATLDQKTLTSTGGRKSKK